MVSCPRLVVFALGNPDDAMRLPALVCLILLMIALPTQAQEVVRDGKTATAGSEETFLFNVAKTAGAEVPCTNGVAAGFPCDNIDLLAHMPVGALGAFGGNRLNDIWGWTDPATGREYALVGRTDGVAFVDVTDPEVPAYLGDLPLHVNGRPSTWRDIKTYQNHAYIVADGAGSHGMQVFDLTQLRGVTAPTRFTATVHYDQIGSAHNIVINETTGFAYAVGTSSGRTCSGGLHMIDIRQPDQPQFVGCFADPGTARGYSHDAQCVIYNGPDTDHQGKEICIGSNEDAISIADVTDKDQPESIAVATYPNAGYVHQGWLSEDHRYFFLDDEFDESRLSSGTRTIIWDLEDLDDPQVLSIRTSRITSIDHNQYTMGDRLYQANYTSGLRVLNIINPADPVEIGYFDTYPQDDAARYSGAWSVYPFFESGTLIVSSIREGLFVLRLGATAFATSLSRVDVQPQGNGLELVWDMDAERANTGFAIEVSRVNEDVFEEVAFVPSLGDTDAPRSYRYDLPDLPPGAYLVRLKLMSASGSTRLSDAVEIFVVPDTHVLDSYPNPFADQLRIDLLLKQSQQVQIAVYNVLGRHIAMVHDGLLEHDTRHQFSLEAANLPAGTYFVRIEGERFAETRELTLVR